MAGDVPGHEAPGHEAPGSSYADSVALSVAAYGLPGGRPVPDRPLSRPDWVAAFDKVRAHQIVGLLMRAVQDGSFAVSQWQRSQVAVTFRDARYYTVALQAQLLRLAGLLEYAGIEFRVLKGAALAALAYPDQALRAYGDVDILVRPAQFEYTIDLLEGEGYQCVLGWHRVGRSHGKGTVLVTAEGYCVDLHYTLAYGPYGRLVPSPDLFAEAQDFPLGGRRLPALPPAERFVHACIHARLGDIPFRLLSVRDVAQCALGADLSWAEVRQLCAKWQVSGIVSESIRAVQDILGISAGRPARPLAHYEPSARERRLIQAYDRADENPAALPLATLLATPGLIRKIDYAYNLLLPGPQYWQGRHDGHRRRWGRLGRALRALLADRLRRQWRPSTGK